MRALIIVCCFTFLIHAFEMFAYSIRLAGIRTRHVATSITFVNVCFLIARLSNMFQAPLLGTMVDGAINNNTVPELGNLFRIVIFAAFLGNVFAALLLPSGVVIFEKAIKRFEKVGSLPRVFFSGLIPRNFVKVIFSLRLPKFKSLPRFRLDGVPKTFLFLNMFVVSIYAIGVLASLFAGAKIPMYRATAIQLSGIVNGIATIMFVLFVDPPSAHLTDQCVHGKKSYDVMRTVVFYLAMGRIAGTLLISQLIFFPATDYILGVVKVLVQFFK
ncbi:lipid II flippase Amj family protein [Candidatus Margulisiibacteriota bacterium]